MDKKALIDQVKKLVPNEEAKEHAYEKAFGDMAELLLNQSVLFIADTPYRLTEIEFYFQGFQHQDIFAHCNPIQKNFGLWYFHRFGKKYRAGTYKGLDITFGSAKSYGGILLRGIASIDSETIKLIDGPCLVVEHILEKTNCQSIQALVDTFDLSVDSPKTGSSSPLYLCAKPDSRGQKIYISPRVGLSLKKGTDLPRKRFICKPYRFLTEPKSIKKGKPHIILSLYKKGNSPEEISKITGSKVAFIDRYIKAFTVGKTKKPEEFAKNLSSKDFCELFGSCQTLF